MLRGTSTASPGKVRTPSPAHSLPHLIAVNWNDAASHADFGDGVSQATLVSCE